MPTKQTVSIDKPHHTENGFKNPDPNFINHGFGALIKWGSSRWKVEHSLDPKDYEFEVIPNDGSNLRENNSRLSVTWIGHATTLVQLDGVNILTDPIWSKRCSPVSWAGPERYTDPGLSMDHLPKIDIVVISHNHYDHMDLPSLLELEKRFSPRFYVGLGNREFLVQSGLSDVVEMDWWEKDLWENPIQKKSLEVYFTPTQHFSARGMFDRDKTLWGSYLLQSKNQRVYFAGDTGYFSGFAEIGKRFPEIDFAILPIGAYEPRWFMHPVHVSPEEAVQAFVDLSAKFMIPMHYGTFVLSDEPLDQPVKLAKSEFQRLGISLDRFLPLRIGESFFRN